MSDETELNAMKDSEETAPALVACAWWRRPRVVAPVVALALVAVGGGSWAGVNAYQNHVASVAFQSALEENTGCAMGLASVLEQARTVQAEALEANEAAGESPAVGEDELKVLADALASAEGIDLSAPPTPVGRDLLRAGAEELSAETVLAQNAIASLTSATASVETQLNTYVQSTYDALVAQARSAIESAQTTLDGSESKVDDNTVRDALSTAIETLKGLASEDETLGAVGSDSSQSGEDSQSGTASAGAPTPATSGDRVALKVKIDELRSAVDDVKAKTVAVSDAQSAWQQAQDAQAQASSTSTGGGASYSGSSYDYTGGGSSGGGGYSGGYSGGGADVCGGGPYCYNPNYPEYAYDAWGNRHHQIQPDANGSYQTAEKVIP